MLLSLEELYNEAEIHSINMSKGDIADIGMFSDNTKITVYEFLEAAEIAYLGWGNSVQKANTQQTKTREEHKIIWFISLKRPVNIPW